MERSFLSPTTCGFAKVAALEASKQVGILKKLENEGNAKFKSRKLQERFNIYCSFFEEHSEAFKIDISTFNKRLPPLQAIICKWNPRKKSERDHFLAKFSVESWQQLSAVKKRWHSLTNCKGCHLDHSSTQALFPVNSPRLKGKGKENPCLVAKPLAKKIKHASKGAVKEVTKEVYCHLNKVYKEWAGETFAQALCKIPEAEVEKKKTNLEKKQERRIILREGKRAIEKKWQETSFLR